MDAVTDNGPDLGQHRLADRRRNVPARVKRDNPADCPGFDFLLRRGIAGIETADMPHHAEALSRAGGAHDSLTIGNRGCHRLLDENVLPCPQGGDGGRGVLVPHGNDGDRLDIGILEKLLIVCVEARHMEAFAEFPQTHLVARAQCMQRGIGQLRQSVAMDLSETAETDDAKPDLVG
jgi:hypothetical protein